jgi:hypothetical protein
MSNETDTSELTDGQIYARDSMGAEFDRKYASNGAHGRDRRKPFGGLSESDVERLVERVSAQVLNNFYLEVGRTVMAKFLWVIGLATVGLLVWLTGSGKLKIF